ncbi:MAG: GntR family transcriptional regulator [Thermoflexales bacterium]|nr:GntR family transcriptional regulator [Thermoflexales bacterium]
MGKHTHNAPPSRSQLDKALAALLKRGQPGDRLPAEPALAAQLGVSRATLREVLRSLQERGLLVRRRGAGTFIAFPPSSVENGLESLESFDAIARRMGLEAQTDHSLIEERPAHPEELAGLGLRSAVRVLSVTRAVAVNGQPVAYLSDVVPLDYLHKGDLGPAFDGSVLDVLIERGRPGLSHARTELAIALADPTLASRLSIKRGAPLFKLEAQVYAQDGRVVDYSLGYFVPGYFRFHVIRRIEK